VASSPPVLEVFTEDPEVQALIALIKGLRHFANRPDFTMRHFKVLAAVEICIKLAKRPARMSDIESYTKLKQSEFEKHVHELVAHRYLHEVIPTFGDPTPATSSGPWEGRSSGPCSGTCCRRGRSRTMASLVRKIQKRNKKAKDGPGKGQAGTPHASVILKLNPKTGKMQEYHLTKGWK
jgi:hypothetical protein